MLLVNHFIIVNVVIGINFTDILIFLIRSSLTQHIEIVRSRICLRMSKILKRYNSTQTRNLGVHHVEAIASARKTSNYNQTALSKQIKSLKRER